MRNFNEEKIKLINIEIAKFMGAKVLPFKINDNVIDTWQECSMDRMNGLDANDNLSFHSSWDWLMPALIKIGSEIKHESFPINVTISGHGGVYIGINSGNCAGEEYLRDKEIINTLNLNYCINDTTMAYKPIELAWLAVAQFVEWYKRNKEL